jgi:hypothetical protein
MFIVNIVKDTLHQVILYNILDVAERHIPKCKETIAKPKPPRKKIVEAVP